MTDLNDAKIIKDYVNIAKLNFSYKSTTTCNSPGGTESSSIYVNTKEGSKLATCGNTHSPGTAILVASNNKYTLIGESSYEQNSNNILLQRRYREKPLDPDKIGDVKVCIQVQKDSGDLEYWIGGDRKKPSLIYKVRPSDNVTVDEIRFESTGKTKNKWILAFKLVSKNSTNTRLLAFRGGSELLDSGVSTKWRYAIYLGNAFWSIQPIIPLFTLNTTSYYSSSGPNISQYETTVISGQQQLPAGEFAWAPRFTYLINPADVHQTVDSGSNLDSYSLLPQNSGVDLQPSVSYADTAFLQTGWAQPPTAQGYDALAAVNPGINNSLPCINKVSATSVEGHRITDQSSESATTAVARTFYGTFSEAGIVDRFGQTQFTNAETFQSHSEIWVGHNSNAFTDCISNTRVINGSSLPTTQENSSTNSTTRSQNVSVSAGWFVAPQVEKPFSEITHYGTDTNTLNAGPTYMPYKVFNDQHSYIYSKTASTKTGVAVFDNKLAFRFNQPATNQNTEQSGTFLNLVGSDVPINVARIMPFTISWVVKEEKLDLYYWDYTSELFPGGGANGNQPLTNLLTKDQRLKEIQHYALEDGNFVEKGKLKGSVLAMRVSGATIQNTEVVGSYYWPKC